MALTSATATISSAGIGSGLDVNSIVTQLMAVERAPLTKLETASATLQTQVSVFGQLKSAISALYDAAAPLYKADSFAMTNATSSDPNGVAATTTTKAVPGTYSVSVSSLSAAQAVVSPVGQYTLATDVVGTGSITVTLGAWSSDQSTFTPKSGATAITIPIGASENTLAGIRDKINAANAGVSASLVTDASGTRIALSSSATGIENAFQITVADDDGDNANAAGLSRLAYAPGNTQMTLAQSAANTEATINGIAVSSTGNTLVNVVDGITFNLSKLTATPVTVNVTRNTDSIKSQLSKFVNAYNQLNQFLTDATKYDPATKQAALLQGDGTTVGIQNQLRALLGQSSGASSVYTSLSSIGVQLQKDGSLKIDDAKLTTAMGNLPELTKALSNVDANTPANNGFAKKFAQWSDDLLGVSGAVPGKTKSLQARIQSNQKDQERMNDRLANIEKRLRAQYSALDSTMANANALSKYVTQQITTWNKSTA